MRYVASTEEACAGKSLSFCGSDDCSGADGAGRVRVTYAHPRQGWLFLKYGQ